MGMYTEIYISCQFNSNLPDDVENALLLMFGGNGELPYDLKIPIHPLFTKPRWGMIGHCSSYYFIPRPISVLFKDGIDNRYYVTSRSDLKNYDGEIEAFWDWVMPYICASEGEMVGYYRYEENDQPTIVYKTPALDAVEKE